MGSTTDQIFNHESALFYFLGTKNAFVSAPFVATGPEAVLIVLGICLLTSLSGHLLADDDDACVHDFF